MHRRLQRDATIGRLGQIARSQPMRRKTGPVWILASACHRFKALTGRPIKTTFSRSSAVVVFVQPRLIVRRHRRKEAGSLWIGMDGALHRLGGQLPVSGIRRMRASARIGTFCSQSHLGRSRHAVAGIRGAFDGPRGDGRRAQQKCLRRWVGQGKSGRHQSSGFQIGEIRNSAASVL